GPGLRVATGYRASRTRYCAFMEGDTAPGEPHSFPTRRSSDLELREYIANDYMPHARDTAGMAALPNGEAWYAFRAKNSTTTDLRDRKSTRLNSSHVKSSYAVFCLKKKKKHMKHESKTIVNARR